MSNPADIPAFLTPQKIEEYKEWLADLAAEAAEAGTFNDCDREVWEYFDPRGIIGGQICSSMTEDELMEPVLATMDRPGHMPQFNEVYVVYRKYIAWRYGSMNTAKLRARKLYKKREAAKLCPPGWQEKVSAAPLLAQYEARGTPATAEQRAAVEALCAKVRKRDIPIPPESLSSGTRALLNTLGGGWRKSFALMGIPVVEKKHRRDVQSAVDKAKADAKRDSEKGR